MNIVNYLNVSNISNLEADSGYLLNRDIMLNIVDNHPEVTFYFLCPEGVPNLHSRIINVPIINPSTSYEARFDFNWRVFKKFFTSENFDAVLVNQPEIASSIYALLASINIKIPIIVYYGYLNIDSLRFPLKFEESLDIGGTGELILMRQMEGAKFASKCLICSNWGKKLFNTAIANMYNLNVDEKFVVCPPLINLSHVEDAFTTERFLKKTIVYNHRLYKHYGTETLIEWLVDFYNHVRNDFQVLVTNPTGKRSPEREATNPVSHYVKQMGEIEFFNIRTFTNRNEYYRAIWKSHLGIGGFTSFRLWSMSIQDVLACGKPVLMYRGMYYDELGGEDYQYYFSDRNEFYRKLDAILSMYDRNEIPVVSNVPCLKFDVNKVSEIWYENIKKCIEGEYIEVY